MISNYIKQYFNENIEIIKKIDTGKIEEFIIEIKKLKKSGGRLFILGVGGSAANASHAVNDFRKILKIEAYTPTDNVSELTAWINDVNWEESYINWLRGSKFNSNDCILILSVGGGNERVSKNLFLCIEYAKSINSKILSIVSRNGGKSLELSDVCILIPVVANERITPHAESWQILLLHLIVNAAVYE